MDISVRSMHTLHHFVEGFELMFAQALRTTLAHNTIHKIVGCLVCFDAGFKLKYYNFNT